MFAKIWTCFMSLVAAATMTMMVAEVFGERRHLYVNVIYLVWDVVGCVDM